MPWLDRRVMVHRRGVRGRRIEPGTPRRRRLALIAAVGWIVILAVGCAVPISGTAVRATSPPRSDGTSSTSGYDATPQPTHADSAGTSGAPDSDTSTTPTAHDGPGTSAIGSHYPGSQLGQGDHGSQGTQHSEASALAKADATTYSWDDGQWRFQTPDGLWNCALTAPGADSPYRSVPLRCASPYFTDQSQAPYPPPLRSDARGDCGELPVLGGSISLRLYVTSDNGGHRNFSYGDCGHGEPSDLFYDYATNGPADTPATLPPGTTLTAVGITCWTGDDWFTCLDPDLLAGFSMSSTDYLIYPRDYPMPHVGDTPALGDSDIAGWPAALDGTWCTRADTDLGTDPGDERSCFDSAQFARENPDAFVAGARVSAAHADEHGDTTTSYAPSRPMPVAYHLCFSPDLDDAFCSTARSVFLTYYPVGATWDCSDYISHSHDMWPRCDPDYSNEHDAFRERLVIEPSHQQGDTYWDAPPMYRVGAS